MTELVAAMVLLVSPPMTIQERLTLVAETPVECRMIKDDPELKNAHAYFDGKLVVFRKYWCNVLNSPRSYHVSQVIGAVWLLGHERSHVRGNISERRANCDGTRYFFEIARKLGIKFNRRDVDDYFILDPCYE